MQILRSKSSNRFCGPASLAAVAGIHVDDAARMLRLVSGKRSIHGTLNRHMLAALDKLGFQAVPVPLVRSYPQVLRPTLAQALRGPLKGRQKAQAYLVNITGHYIAIEGRSMLDNRHPEGIALTQCPYLRKRVKYVWAITRVKQVTLPLTRAQFERALNDLGLSTDGDMIDAPDHHRFRANDTHCIAITGTYEEALEDINHELPLVPCPQDCDCREDY